MDYRRPKTGPEVFEKHGRLKCFDNGELVVELETETISKRCAAILKSTLGTNAT